MEDDKSIYEWSIQELWAAFLQLMEQETDNGERIEKYYKGEIARIKHGYELKFPIHYLTNEWYEEYPSSKSVKVFGYGKHDLNQFVDEREKRESVMRKILLENQDEGGITEPRI